MNHTAWEFVGGSLALDFCNTVGSLREGKARDYLSDYVELVDWSRAAGIVSVELADRLIDQATIRSEEAARIHARAIALRNSIDDLARRCMKCEAPSKESLAIMRSSTSPIRGGSWRARSRLVMMLCACGTLGN